MSEYITNNDFTCDGGEYMSTVKEDLYTDEDIHVLQISNLDLWVTNTKNPSIGLRLILPGQSCPVFISLPWSKLLGILSNGKNTCVAMHSCAQTQPQSLSRGRRNHIFTDHDSGPEGRHNYLPQQQCALRRILLVRYELIASRSLC
jgi:hypothetical protein